MQIRASKSQNDLEKMANLIRDNQLTELKAMFTQKTQGHWRWMGLLYKNPSYARTMIYNERVIVCKTEILERLEVLRA